MRIFISSQKAHTPESAMRLPFLIPFLLTLVLLGSCERFGVLTPEMKDYSADFDSVWTNFDKYYPLFTYKHVPWKDIGNRYRPRFSSISVGDRNTLLAEMLSVLKDEHIYLQPVGGDPVVPYWNSRFARNDNEQFISSFTASISWKKENESWGWGRIAGAGYLRFKSFSGDKLDTVIFDRALDSLKFTTGLIIDVRFNGGGALPVCEEIWNRFAKHRTQVGYELYRSGPGYDDYAPRIAIEANPQGSWQYVQKVVVLTGRMSASAAEVFAQAMSELEQVTLLGDTTRGSVTAPSTFTLEDGTQYRVPIVAYFSNSGVPLEWNGVPPDIYADGGASTAEDAILEQAIKLINGGQARTQKKEPFVFRNR
jgi:carboxyl-terminal processing protease